MPYIVSYCRSGCTAVATLEEARELVFGLIEYAVPYPAHEAGSIGETGGVVGPLMDGSIIDVEQVGWWDLADGLDVPRQTVVDNAGRKVLRPVCDEQGRRAILNAFNERQRRV